jgi:hypothetical protein
MNRPTAISAGLYAWGGIAATKGEAKIEIAKHAVTTDVLNPVSFESVHISEFREAPFRRELVPRLSATTYPGGMVPALFFRQQRQRARHLATYELNYDDCS